MRHQTFFTLADLNRVIRVLIDELNRRPFKKLPGTRLSQFEALDKPALKQLPAERYEYLEFKLARVNIDYHIEFDKHYYSVPHHLVKSQIEVQASRETVAVFFKGQQVARHARCARQGGFSTHTDHMPDAHRQHQTWTPQRLRSWGQRIGCSTEKIVATWLEQKQHPEQAYRACLGLLNLAKEYSPARLEAACLRAIHIQALRLKNVKSILKSNMDQLPLPPHPEQSTIDDHHNVRGSDYYH